MRHLALGISLVAVTVLFRFATAEPALEQRAVAADSAAAVNAREREEDEDEEAIEHMMEKVHEGKRSPLKTLQGQLQGETDWVAVGKLLQDFSKMSKLLTTAKNDEIRDSADGYADSVKELVAAATKKDKAAAVKAYKGLIKTCGDCHYKGGVGGKLD